MVEEILARLRGVSKWPEVEATVYSVNRNPAQGRSPATATVTFSYRPDGGEVHSGSFFIGDQSSLYYLDENGTFPLRYDPARPERFWSDEYVVPSWWKFYAVLIAAFAAVLLYVFFARR